MSISGLKDGAVSLNITELLGKTVYEQEQTVISGNAQVNGLEALIPGVYLVSISQNDKSTTKGLIVK